MMSSFKLKGESLNIVDENISKLKELFPEMVTGDNEIDFDAFRDLFEENGQDVVDDGEEHYKFTWWGKKEAKRVAKETTTKTLRPVKKDSKNWDTTQNIYIEGDNLDALKILLGSYRNRIKMIYIDPPYNTGHDFVYKDNRTETIQEHLESTEQLSEEGYLFENAKTDGKFHSNWLNMMYPRLVLARKLLTEDGVIFISIDDNEVSNLKNICNEIFGESNFIAEFIWQKMYAPKNNNKYVSTDHEQILCYAKNLEKIEKFNRLPRDEKANSMYRYDDNDGRGPYRLSDLTMGGKKGYDIIWKGKVYKEPENIGWRYTEERMYELIKDGRIHLPDDENKRPSYKRYLSDVEGVISKTILPYDEVNHTDGSKRALNKLLGTNIFDYPKPVELIYRFILLGSNSEDIILDFFSGSSTTAHAVMKLNIDEKANRKFIMVQIPEETDDKSEAYKAGFENICEIGKERIRRAGDKIVEENKNTDLDIGFKVFKVDESNFIPWNPNLSSENIGQAILSTADNLVDGRSELDLIYELLLQLNMDLTCPVEEIEQNGHKVYVIDNGYALICLENKLDKSIADDLLKLKEDLMVEYCQVILKDSALDDNASINIYETLNTNNVEYYTI